MQCLFFFFSSRRRHTRLQGDWSSDVCSSDLDGRMAVVGGRNIGEEYFEAGKETNFRDLDMVLFGPAVTQASGVFDAYWNSKIGRASCRERGEKVEGAWVRGEMTRWGGHREAG